MCLGLLCLWPRVSLCLRLPYFCVRHPLWRTQHAVASNLESCRRISLAHRNAVDKPVCLCVCVCQREKGGERRTCSAGSIPSLVRFYRCARGIGGGGEVTGVTWQAARAKRMQQREWAPSMVTPSPHPHPLHLSLSQGPPQCTHSRACARTQRSHRGCVWREREGEREREREREPVVRRHVFARSACSVARHVLALVGPQVFELVAPPSRAPRSQSPPSASQAPRVGETDRFGARICFCELLCGWRVCRVHVQLAFMCGRRLFMCGTCPCVCV